MEAPPSHASLPTLQPAESGGTEVGNWNVSSQSIDRGECEAQALPTSASEINAQ